MPYRMRYTWNIDWVPAGSGATQPNANDSANGCSGGAQTKGFINAPGGTMVLGHATGGLFDATDVSTVTVAAAADMTTQLTAALAQLQGFATGGG